MQMLLWEVHADILIVWCINLYISFRKYNLSWIQDFCMALFKHALTSRWTTKLYLAALICWIEAI